MRGFFSETPRCRREGDSHLGSESVHQRRNWRSSVLNGEWAVHLWGNTNTPSRGKTEIRQNFSFLSGGMVWGVGEAVVE